MSEKILEVKHLGKAFGSNQVLRDIDFSVSPGDVTCIIGPSGSGKSTLLRCLNMLETPSTGEINYHGTDITSKNVHVLTGDVSSMIIDFSIHRRNQLSWN